MSVPITDLYVSLGLCYPVGKGNVELGKGNVELHSLHIVQ